MKDYIYGAIVGTLLALALFFSIPNRAHALTIDECPDDAQFCNHEDTTP